MHLTIILWFAVAAVAYCAPPAEIVSLRQLLDLLKDARTLDFEGNPPNDPHPSATRLKYPIRLSGRVQIQPVSGFFLRTQFRKDEIATEAFRGGGKISSNIYTQITVNGKYRCTVLSGTSLILANHLAFEAVGTEGDGGFHNNLASAIGLGVMKSLKVKKSAKAKR